ncbi:MULTISPECIES: hypothetical protein [unclassified Modestobacter]|uniref:hypothetical protein n=1 Tax=unclassified Modestobacter TaxID=2643866 RepID=UPI0022AA2AEB|nr:MULTISPECIES: hypothetical protein [unclassified Modestobacter]MCZ2825013.1 hypothetical protein [Modestobacter sp. VKM Ac-2981]MCZ2854484.1 hypothetical protein [Modestobacter sp. VKM Ac-2982]
MSDEQDVLAAGTVDRGRRTETGSTAAVVPDQRTQGEPEAAPPTAPDAAPPAAPAGERPDGVPAGASVPASPAPAADGAPEPRDDPAAEPQAAPHPTAPVGFRPRPRMPRPGLPMVRMGPWAPVAGAGLGLLLGLVVVLSLAPAVDTFDQRLSLVFVVLGLTLLGAGGTLLADEVRLLRRGAQAAEARASNAGVIAGMLNGLTPARLLITASAFVLLLSAYVTNGGV